MPQVRQFPAGHRRTALRRRSCTRCSRAEPRVGGEKLTGLRSPWDSNQPRLAVPYWNHAAIKNLGRQRHDLGHQDWAPKARRPDTVLPGPGRGRQARLGCPQLLLLLTVPPLSRAEPVRIAVRC